MSTLRATTLANLAGTGSPAIVGGELCRARFNLNGTGTIAARDTFNVASFVDNGVGSYSCNVTASFPNAFYDYNVNAAGGSALLGFPFDASISRTVNQFSASTRDAAISPIDASIVDCNAFGDAP